MDNKILSLVLQTVKKTAILAINGSDKQADTHTESLPHPTQTTDNNSSIKC